MELSVIVVGNSEMFHAKTVQDLIDNTGEMTEIIAVIDGGIWPKDPIPFHPRVNIVYIPNTIGQRAATNVGVRLSKSKYVVKTDAHCSFDKDFDQKMLDAFKETGDNVTMVPIMRNLHAFSWKCYKCGSKWYQGPTPTRCMYQTDKEIIPNEKCNETKNFKRKMVWLPRRGTYSQAYSFDSEPHFQYFNEYKHRPEYKEAKEKLGLTESMSLQGSFFMATRDKYWELNLSDESVGSWGNQGLEVSCKTWLSGGRVLVNHKTWYAHMFRTQGGDFGFPYDQSGNAVDKAKKRVWEHFFNGKFKQQIHPVSWLIEKFWPIPVNVRKGNNSGIGWTLEALDLLKQKEKGIIKS